MKKITVNIIAWVIAVACCIALFLKLGDNYQDIPGTVIAKSGDLKSRYKSTRVYTEYIFAIHPDDNRLSDFDIEVPLHSYIKYNVGDRIILHDENINRYLKDPKWYEKDGFWAIILVVILLISVVYLIWVLLEHFDYNEIDYE